LFYYEQLQADEEYGNYEIYSGNHHSPGQSPYIFGPKVDNRKHKQGEVHQSTQKSDRYTGYFTPFTREDHATAVCDETWGNSTQIMLDGKVGGIDESSASKCCKK
jgi:hypothetical protein